MNGYVKISALHVIFLAISLWP